MACSNNFNRWKNFGLEKNEIDMEERVKKIVTACLQEKSKNPIEIFYNIAQKDFVRIHGPEHHVLDGAALSIIDGTGPLSTDASWGKHMEFTSKALCSLSKVGGPRCCKRDAFLCFQNAIKYVNENYNVELENSKIECYFSEKNEQCIKEKCPFYKREKKKVAFICVHNSCRSQIAEALGKYLASDEFE